MGSTRTSRRKTSTEAEAGFTLVETQSGFTLIELLVVVFLIGMVAMFALPSIGSYSKMSLDAATREIASVVKESYNTTMVTGHVHRVVWDLKDNQYWTEAGPPNVLLDTAETREKEEERKKFGWDDDKKKQPSSPFMMDHSVTRKKKSLPRGAVFEDVLTERSKDPVTDGLAYTHMFPQGITEQTIIHLKDGADHHISLIISPLVGRTRLVQHYVTAEEAFGEK